MKPNSPNKAADQMRLERAIAAGQGNKFDQLVEEIRAKYPETLVSAETAAKRKPGYKATEVSSLSASGYQVSFMSLLQHRYSTAWFKHSDRKLNDLSRLIARLPVDQAILQMQLSDKKPAKRILSTLALARDHAIAKGLAREKLIVGQSDSA